MMYFRAIAVTIFGASSAALPQLLPVVGDISESLLRSLTSLGQSAVDQLNSGPPQENPPFDAQRQHVDVSGIHEWRAPGPNDARGPCPGLNALANHAYLPRNGYATILDLTSATTQVYGMGLDLATILSAYGAVLDGVGVAWSIGGQQHTGISGSHNNYETDSSPMRADLHQYGSNVDLVMSQFMDLYNSQPDSSTANYNIDVLADFRGRRLDESIAKNPWFYYGPFTGTSVSQAAFAFIYRFFANHTAEHPAGILNRDVLKSFFAVYGDENNLTWRPGHERIPDNWYKRAVGDGYGLNGLGSDIGRIARRYPASTTAGCNTGTVNTFTPINNTYSDGEVNEPKDGVCYGIARAIQAANVDIVNGVVQLLLLPIQNALDCTTVPLLNDSVRDTCPGYSLYGGPQGEVAPGAIQS